MQPLLHFVLFIALGILVAAPGEYVVHMIAFPNLAEYLRTLFISYPILLALIYGMSSGINRLVRRRWVADVVTWLVVGLFGLMFEWFVLNNSPWGNPDANQFGMFSFWASLALFPRLFLDSRPGLRALRWAVAIFLVLQAVIVLLISLIPESDVRLFVGIVFLIISYWLSNVFFVWYVWHGIRLERRAPTPLAPSPSP